MPKSFAVAAMLLFAAASVAAQSSGAQPAGDGGAYYQFVLGLHLETAGDAAGAVAAYQRAEKLDPQSAEVPAALAALYARMNRSTDAVAAGEGPGQGGAHHP